MVSGDEPGRYLMHPWSPLTHRSNQTHLTNQTNQANQTNLSS